uniref:Uncharacterized protein n=1 Tax=Salix viminalis TaxID=40686 RepID=A0A6N2MD47_SALVM
MLCFALQGRTIQVWENLPTPVPSSCPDIVQLPLHLTLEPSPAATPTPTFFFLFFYLLFLLEIHRYIIVSTHFILQLFHFSLNSCSGI